MKILKVFMNINIFVITFLLQQSVEAQYIISNSTFSIGYGELSSNEFILSSTLGQPIIGSITDESNIIHGGHWYVFEEYLSLDAEIRPPSNLQVSDVPNDNGHSLTLTWFLSPDDTEITHYYIYRSRNPELTEPVMLESFDTLEALIEAEQEQTILIGMVDAGVQSFNDLCVPLNNVTYYYWIASVSETGKTSKLASSDSGITSVNNSSLPINFKLIGNFPNPFNPSTEIKYEIPNQCHVKLIIYSLSGQHIKTLFDKPVSAGSHAITWKPTGLSTGMYLYILEAGEKRFTDKMLFLK